MSRIILTLNLLLGAVFAQNTNDFLFRFLSEDSLVFETPECCSQEDSLLAELKASRVEVKTLLQKSKAGDKKSAKLWQKLTSVVVLRELGNAPLIKRDHPEELYSNKEVEQIKPALRKLPMIDEVRDRFISQLDNEDPYLVDVGQGDFFEYQAFRNGQWLANVYLDPGTEKYPSWAYQPIETSFGQTYQLVLPWICTNPSVRRLLKADTVEVPVEVLRIDTLPPDTILMLDIPEEEECDTVPIEPAPLLRKSDFYLYGGRWFPKERDSWYSPIEQPFGTEFFGGGASFFASRKDFSKSHFGPSVGFNSYHSYGLAFMEDDRGSVYDTTGFHSYGLRASLGVAGIFPLSSSVIVGRLLAGAQWDWSHGGGYKSRQVTPMVSPALTYDKWYENADLSYWATANLSFWGRKLSSWQGEGLSKQEDPANNRDDIGHGLRWFGWKKVMKDKQLSDGSFVKIKQLRKVNYGLSVRNLFWGETGSDINGRNIAKAITAGPGIRVVSWNLNIFMEYKYVWDSHWSNNNGHSIGLIMEIWDIQKYAPKK